MLKNLRSVLKSSYSNRDATKLMLILHLLFYVQQI